MGQKELELCQLYANNGSVPPVDAAECALMQNGELRTAAAKTEACRGEGEPPHHASVGQGRADRAAGRHARDDELAACKAELAASVNAHAALQYTLATYCAEIEEIRSLCEKHGVNVRAGRNDPVPQRPWDVKKEGECSEEKNEVLRVANAEIEELRCKVMRLEAIVRSLACAVGVEQHARAEDEKLRKRLHEELQAEQSARTAAECACHVEKETSAALRAELAQYTGRACVHGPTDAYSAGDFATPQAPAGTSGEQGKGEDVASDSPTDVTTQFCPVTHFPCLGLEV